MKRPPRCYRCYCLYPPAFTVRFASVLMQATTRYPWERYASTSWVCAACAEAMAGQYWRVALRLKVRRGL